MAQESALEHLGRSQIHQGKGVAQSGEGRRLPIDRRLSTHGFESIFERAVAGQKLDRGEVRAAPAPVPEEAAEVGLVIVRGGRGVHGQAAQGPFDWRHQVGVEISRRHAQGFECRRPVARLRVVATQSENVADGTAEASLLGPGAAQVGGQLVELAPGDGQAQAGVQEWTPAGRHADLVEIAQQSFRAAAEGGRVVGPPGSSMAVADALEQPQGRRGLEPGQALEAGLEGGRCRGRIFAQVLARTPHPLVHAELVAQLGARHLALGSGRGEAQALGRTRREAVENGLEIARAEGLGR